MSNPTGIIFNIQKFSTEDGPGIRTTIFMKGCPLKCLWCHNPEGKNSEPDLIWYDTKCIAARDCIATCPENALKLTLDGIQIDRGICTVCGDCVDVCPTAALEVIGQEWTTEALFNEILKDKVFYETSGGGITFSGGEPMMQVNFLKEILVKCKQAGFHNALDTCGSVSWSRYKAIISYIDLVLLDIKILDSSKHLEATGVSNQLILDNAKKLSSNGIPMWIRTPIIPGYTQSKENILAIGKFIDQELATVQRWDLLAYTNLGRPKYHRLDLPYLLEEVPLLTKQEMTNIWETASKIVANVKWSGLAV